MTKIMRSVSIALAAAAIGCMGGGRGQTARAPARTTAEPADPPAEAAAPGRSGGTMPGCPIAVPGTQVAVADVPAGAAMTFTTAEPNVEELRTRVHEMARMHDAHHGGGMRMGGGMHGAMHPREVPAPMPSGGGAPSGTGSAGAPEHGAMMMPPSSRALAEEVEGGARIVITAEDPADLERLRSAVRAHAAQMRETGACEMAAEPPASR